MFLFTNFFSVFIPFWGMLGLWTTRIGYHNRVRYRLINHYYSAMLADIVGTNSGNSTFIMLSLGSFRRLIMRYVSLPAFLSGVSTLYWRQYIYI
jgi:hypothetical protein